MKNKIQIVLAIILIIQITACNNSKKVNFAVVENYYLAEHEKEALRTQQTLNAYKKYNTNLEHQTPLEKNVLSKNYTIYFGIALNDTPEKMFTVNKNDSLHTIYQTKEVTLSEIKAYCLFTKNTGSFNYKLIYKSPKKPFYTSVLNIESKDSTLINKMYESNSILTEKLKYK